MRSGQTFIKNCLSVITWNEKHLSKQVVPATNTLEKTFSAVDTFEGLIHTCLSLSNNL